MPSGQSFLSTIVRPWRRADVPAIARLYFETVRHVNARDYRPEQIEAWAPRIGAGGYWLRRFRDRSVFVAEVDGQVAGFAELVPDGHIDCFYAHRSYQGSGVGRAMMRQLIDAARSRRLARLTVDVSRTALAFFRAQGFRVVRRQARRYRGRTFAQWHMSRPMRRPMRR